MGKMKQQQKKTIANVIALYGVKALVYLVRSVTIIAYTSQIWLLVSLVALAQTNLNSAAYYSSQFAYYYGGSNQSLLISTNNNNDANKIGEITTATTTTDTSASSFFGSIALFPSVDWLLWLVQTHPIVFALSELYLFSEVVFYCFYLASWKKLQRARVTRMSPIASLSSKGVL